MQQCSYLGCSMKGNRKNLNIKVKTWKLLVFRICCSIWEVEVSSAERIKEWCKCKQAQQLLFSIQQTAFYF